MSGDVLASLRSVNLDSLKRFRREVLALLILLALSVFFFKVLYPAGEAEKADLSSRTRALESEIELAAAEVAAVEGLKIKVRDAEVRLAGVNRRIASLKERLPSDKQISEILAEVYPTGERTGFRVVAVKPLAPITSGELLKLPFHISMESGFTAFGRYLERLEKLPRIMTIDNFMIEAPDDGTTGLSTQIYLSAYVLSEKGGKP